MKLLLIVLGFAAMLTGCAAQAPSQNRISGARSQATETLVDYAGKPCGDQSMHVKSPVCLFPHLESPRGWLATTIQPNLSASAR
jgi:hypothetical protein